MRHFPGNNTIYGSFLGDSIYRIDRYPSLFSLDTGLFRLGCYIFCSLDNNRTTFEYYFQEANFVFQEPAGSGHKDISSAYDGNWEFDRHIQGKSKGILYTSEQRDGQGGGKILQAGGNSPASASLPTEQHMQVQIDIRYIQLPQMRQLPDLGLDIPERTLRDSHSHSHGWHNCKTDCSTNPTQAYPGSSLRTGPVLWHTGYLSTAGLRDTERKTPWTLPGHPGFPGPNASSLEALPGPGNREFGAGIVKGLEKLIPETGLQIN